ncbi:uncharacterized protein G2W53_044339 [Senna tora]|uniref:Alpha-(1,6)-fucosyltransferase n=1 Tax=Senna tora TaxID=362788 RepID=A0A834SM79_9FABA|nr:uncharacterized protein G2W53_044339 [Senna tora]
METLNHKSLERVVSHKALQMGSSFPCQICVVGFLCGICLTSLFLAALTSFATFQFGPISFSAMSIANSTSGVLDMVTTRDCNYKPKEDTEDRVSLLYSAWSVLLSKSTNEANEYLQKKHGINESNLPNAPHLENCIVKQGLNERLDMRIGNQTFPPWIAGSDEENYPLTRKVQRDLWIHQHPLNCRQPDLKFLVADWERLPGFGIGAQIVGMCGLLAIAINEGRILVTNYYNRADHDGCKGSSRSSWSCYFFPETSAECRHRAFELMKSEEAWRKGIVTTKENYTSKHIWAGPTPRKWGDPWDYLQPTTEVNGSLLASHRKMDKRWWRAQAVRYLMRFPSEYTCNLLNDARHAAFGKLAAKMVLESVGMDWRKEYRKKGRSEIEEYVWSNHKAWVPRPLVSMHVRMGDKACEMKVVEFEEYMRLADRIRKHFPNVNSIWLSTEMQEVIDKSESGAYSEWKFYYSKVRRQVRSNMSMAEYEGSLGRERSSNYPLVNFLMAADSDFFVGALGSTWCFLIDAMRNTAGKLMAAYLSVNKDRFW